MKKTKTIKIDGEKLTAELKKRGVSKTSASKELGMGMPRQNQSQSQKNHLMKMRYTE